MAARDSDRRTAWELDELTRHGLQASGADVLLIEPIDKKPFRYQVTPPGGATFLLSVYIRNVTHGGAKRPPDEYRIQLTGALPRSWPGHVTVILGWRDKEQVFVGWDLKAHLAHRSGSPSLQVREATMVSAAASGIAAATRDSGDLVVAVRPELLSTYCVAADELHGMPASQAASFINALSSAVLPEARPTVSRTFDTWYRAWDFSHRVLRAYNNRCAVCGLGLGLLEGAHIVPVAWPGSTDETSNGIALCRNHHAAYDRALISFSDDHRIEISPNVRRSVTDSIDSGWISAIEGRPMLLPTAIQDRPSAYYLRLGRQARGWAR